MKLRCYQVEAKDAILKSLETNQRTLCVLPTGGGKTIVAAHVGDNFKSKGRIIVVAHRDELLRQAGAKFLSVTGISPEYEKGDEYVDESCIHGSAPLVIASVQSLNSGGEKKRRMHRFDPNEFSFLWIDEGHHAVADSYRRVLDHFCTNPNLKVLFVTATPDRADERGLREVCDNVAYDYELPDIIADGYLVPIHQRRVVIDGLDFSKVSTIAGDLDQGELEAAMLLEKPLHGVVHATLEIAGNLKSGSLNDLRDDELRSDKLSQMLNGRAARKSLVFTVTVAHAHKMAEILNRWMPDSAIALDGETPKEERPRILKDFASGRFRFLCNCMIATEGFDEPSIELVVIARPTKSRPLYSQMIGRGTRPANNVASLLGRYEQSDLRRKMILESEKPFVEVLDFVGNSGRHKLVTTADILGPREDDAVVDRANEIALEQSIDMQEALELAEDELAASREAAAMLAEEDEQKIADQQQAELVEATARRAKLVATGSYNSYSVDPFGNSSGPMRYESRMGGASEKQINCLVKFGFRMETAAAFSKSQASAIISKKIKEREARRNGTPDAEIAGMFGGVQ